MVKRQASTDARRHLLVGATRAARLRASDEPRHAGNEQDEQSHQCDNDLGCVEGMRSRPALTALMMNAAAINLAHRSSTYP